MRSLGSADPEYQADDFARAREAVGDHLELHRAWATAWRLILRHELRIARLAAVLMQHHRLDEQMLMAIIALSPIRPLVNLSRLPGGRPGLFPNTEDDQDRLAHAETPLLVAA
jgi:hypothetical protein